MDELQAFRMTMLWPTVVGAAAFLLARALLWLIQPALRREHAAACAIVGVAGAVVAWSIAVAWDDGPFWWVAFTVGMAVLATVMVVTCVLLGLEMWHER